MTAGGCTSPAEASAAAAQAPHACSSGAAVPATASTAAVLAPAASLVDLALQVLHEPDPFAKAALTAAAAAAWRAGGLPPAPPDAAGRAAAAARVLPRPARADAAVRVVGYRDAPRRDRGGSLARRQALLHSLAHIENWAVDLAWDVIARWGSDEALAAHLPRAFFDDFVAVAEDEARHFTLLEARLRDSGSHYGALPVHDTLWDAAAGTAHSLPARLAIEHCCHEARGLDVLPSTIAKFKAAGDEQSADLLQGVIYPEEVSHCAAGLRWLKHLHAEARALVAGGGSSGSGSAAGAAAGQPVASSSGGGEAVGGSGTTALPAWAADALRHGTPRDWFHALVREHYGHLKGPFNKEARAAAGFEPDWYEPLVKEAQGAAAGSGGGGGGAVADGDGSSSGAAASRPDARGSSGERRHSGEPASRAGVGSCAVTTAAQSLAKCTV